MTRRRRAPIALRVCAGVFVLLFGIVVADTTKGPPPSSDKPFALDETKPSLSENNATIPRNFSERRNESAEPSRKNFETVDEEVDKDGRAKDKEKVAMPIGEQSPVQEIRSPDEPDRLSTADSPNGGSKLEENLYGTLGKSSSTKTVSEDTYRLSRTNGLTTVTTKPVADESKLDEKRNKTISGQGSVDDAERSNRTDSLPTNEHAITKIANSSPSLEILNDGDESSTEPARPEPFQERRKKAEHPSSTKNSEVPDLKEADANGQQDISLVNDTHVNYYKTSTVKNAQEESQSRANATNSVPEAGEVTHESKDPKGDVEVVGSVTHPVIQRIVESQNSTSKDENESNRGSNQDARDSTEASHIVEQQERINERNRQKLMQITTERTHREETTIQTPSSPVPRGRTIAFSGVNEFPNVETKPTIATKLDRVYSTRNITTQKPYPYSKSLGNEQLHNSSNQLDSTTEEVSALENTIGKGGSDEKFIVTEASDVLENSIQQFKPTYYEKPGNESIVSSTEARTSATTPASTKLEDAKPTNETVPDESNNPVLVKSNETILDKSSNPVPDKSKDPKTRTEEKTRNGNDVSRWSEARDEITGKEFDVTGNRITEVSQKPEDDKRDHEVTSQTDRTSTESTTELGLVSNVDVQTNAEGSLLIRSSLNATEVSTEYPLIKGNFSDEKSTTLDTTRVTESPITVQETFTGNVTQVPGFTDANGTNEIPSGAGETSSTDEALVQTTTSIEYEFVGLTESTTVFVRNVTEAVSTDSSTDRESFTQPSTPTETSTTAGETTTDNPSSTEMSEEITTEDRTSSFSVTDQTVTIPSPTTLVDDFTTVMGVVDGVTDQTTTEDAQRTVTETWSTSDKDVTETVIVEYTTLPSAKDISTVLNVSEGTTEFTTTDISTTDAIREATSNPFVPSSLRPRIPVSSTTNPPAVSDITIRLTDETKVSPTQEEVMPLVRIVMEGSLHDVCLKKNELRSALAEILKSVNNSISDEQIIFHQDPCQESASSAATASDMTSILVYVVDENGKVNSTMTTSLPDLYKNSHVIFPLKIHSFVVVQEPIPDSGNAIAVVVVSSIAFICLVLLAGLLFIMRKRQTRFNYGERCRPVSLDAYSLDSVSAYNSVRRKGVARSSKRSYGNPTFEDSSAIPSHPLNFAGLSSFCNDVNAINEEFAGIPQVSAKIDEMPNGAEVKNRYANVIPLPETRVPLQKINNDPLTEYINASYVRGPKNAMRYYIACQAPMDSTVTDFWRMIWEQQCKVIIMLTDLVENGVEKCTEYVPPSEITDCHRLYGDFQVTLKKRETKEKYAISTLHLKNLENNTFREVYHIWYLWPVNGVQSDGAGLIAVLLEARALQRGGPGPIVVHCSPGTGRTGTLIALDLGIRQYEITRTVDVPRVVYTIRRDRAGAVQTKEQYAFVYKSLHLYATKLAGGILEST